MLQNEQITHNIHQAFQGVTLENGIGLWESQGHDDRLSQREIKKLRAKDEKEYWNSIPLLHLYQCSSSLSFFDAKGMRFHLPILLLIALDHFVEEETQLAEKVVLQGCDAPDIVQDLITTAITRQEPNSQYLQERFALLNTAQVDCIISALQLKKEAMRIEYESYAKTYGTNPKSIENDNNFIELTQCITYWENEKSLKI